MKETYVNKMNGRLDISHEGNKIILKTLQMCIKQKDPSVG
jgi:hypothetical protein